MSRVHWSHLYLLIVMRVAAAGTVAFCILMVPAPIVIPVFDALSVTVGAPAAGAVSGPAIAVAVSLRGVATAATTLAVAVVPA